tara:strand:- start:1559 stop:1945 length:387 start_codon:yes stop_codon:yes gene_type:complete
MTYIKSLKNAWVKGFKYKGKSTKQEFLEYYLIHYSIIIFVNIIQLVVTSAIYKTIDYNYGIVFELFNVFSKLIEFVFFLYKLGSIIIQIPLSIRCLRNAGAKWQWSFLNIINPIGCIVIYFLPLKNKK